ncbi:hypothetical protein NliqN6_6366 [Naganishia liquefaciens]|uniref:Uncharacterized protein n=1 Tax=Naganishia liquefaciens TaxID=104408 RepID=A0A8H3YHJ8_9TREE|nr:hypothetical protein NliqN6_6366 [Naganishia liquefaciens]
MSGTATTGPENPLKTYNAAELQQIESAETAYNNAIDAFKNAEARGESKERVNELRDLARSKEEELRSLQDLCD